MALDPQLLEILACPDAHHAPLAYDQTAESLTCAECGRVFPIRDGIPVLLLDEATRPAPADSKAATEAVTKAVADATEAVTEPDAAEHFVAESPEVNR